MFNYQMAQGWECPRCNRINAPTNPQCFCSIQTSYTTYGGTESVKDQDKPCRICGGYHLSGVICKTL